MDNNTVLLKRIITEGFNQRIDDTLSARIKGVECSKKHSEAMGAIVEGRVTGNVVWTTKMRRVVALLVAALLLLTGCAVVYHEEIFGFFKEISDSAIRFTAEVENEPLKKIEEIYELSYLPEGYTLEESANLIIAIHNTYVDDNGNKMTFSQRIAGSGKGGVSNENTNINYHVVKKYEIVEVIGSINYIYIWHDGAYEMELNSVERISIEQLEMIMDGIVVRE